MDDSDDARQRAEIEAISAIFEDVQICTSGEHQVVVVTLPELCKAGAQPTSVRFELPPDYPSKATPICTVSCTSFGPAENQTLAALARQAAVLHPGEEAMLAVVQQVQESWENLEEKWDVKQQQAQTTHGVDTVQEINDQILGRRLMYSHHIIAQGKRKNIREWAEELDLTAIWKIGWPGIIVCEGAESDCQEYVRRLQSLRWKHFVVRGEQQVSLSEGTVQVRDIDQLRALPQKMRTELAENEMNVLADMCKQAGLEDLFLTSMKVYK